MNAPEAPQGRGFAGPIGEPSLLAERLLARGARLGAAPLPVNPVSPEEAVAELLQLGRRGVDDGSDGAGLAPSGPRSWDAFPRDVVR